MATRKKAPAKRAAPAKKTAPRWDEVTPVVVKVSRELLAGQTSRVWVGSASVRWVKKGVDKVMGQPYSKDVKPRVYRGGFANSFEELVGLLAGWIVEVQKESGQTEVDPPNWQEQARGMNGWVEERIQEGITAV